MCIKAGQFERNIPYKNDGGNTHKSNQQANVVQYGITDLFLSGSMGQTKEWAFKNTSHQLFVGVFRDAVAVLHNFNT